MQAIYSLEAQSSSWTTQQYEYNAQNRTLDNHREERQIQRKSS
jgi:hypothetical protein